MFEFSRRNFPGATGLVSQTRPRVARRHLSLRRTPNLRKLLIGVAVLAVAAVPALAFAQNPAPVVTNDVSITPSKAGTTKKPKAAKFSFKVVNSAASKTTVKQIVLDLPKGVVLSGNKLAACSADDFVQNAGCPSNTKLGTGVAYSFIVAPTPAPDCVGTNGAASGCLTFDTSFYVGGKNALTVGLQQRGGPAFPPLTGKITSSGRKLTITIPAELQQPVPGTFSALLQLSGSFSRSKTVSGKKYSFVSTTGCTSKKWAVKSTLVYAANTAPAPASGKATDNVKCSK
jgi:hypothetical protein